MTLSLSEEGQERARMAGSGQERARRNGARRLANSLVARRALHLALAGEVDRAGEVLGEVDTEDTTFTTSAVYQLVHGLLLHQAGTLHLALPALAAAAVGVPEAAAWRGRRAAMGPAEYRAWCLRTQASIAEREGREEKMRGDMEEAEPVDDDLEGVEEVDPVEVKEDELSERKKEEIRVGREEEIPRMTREDEERVRREVERLRRRERTAGYYQARGVEGEAEASTVEREAKVRLVRAQELVEEGSLEEAIRLLNSCLRLNPKEYYAWSLRNEVSIRLSRQRREEERREAEQQRSERTREWMESGWREEARKRR